MATSGEVKLQLKIDPSSITAVQKQIGDIHGTATVDLKLDKNALSKIRKSIEASKITAPIAIQPISKKTAQVIKKSVSSIKPKADVALDIKKSSLKSINGNAISKKIGRITVQGFKADKSVDNLVKNVRSKLQAGISNVEKNTTGVSSKRSTVDSVAKKSTIEAKASEQAINRWKSSIKALNQEMSIMGEKYKKARANMTDSDEIRYYTDRNLEFKRRLAELKSTPVGKQNNGEIKNFISDLNTLNSQLSESIAKQERSKAAAKEAAAEQKLAAKEAAKAEREKAREAANAEKQAEKASKKRSSAKKSAADEVAMQAAAQKKIADLNQRIEKTLTYNSRMIGTQYETMLRGVTKGLNPKSETFKNEYANANTRFQNVMMDASAAGKTGQSFMGRLSKTYQRLVSYGVVTSIFYQIGNAMRSVYGNVVNIDTAMTQLRKVTDETDATYNRFFEGVNDRAKSIGTTMSDTINATADFARLGYDIDTASQMADAALVYKNVGDNITDISQASESLTSTIQAFKSFGIEASDAMGVVDRFNEVGKDYCPAA